MDDIHWLGHACIKITGNAVIYIDPYHISSKEPADFIFITHEHYDHLSTKDIQKIRTEDTIFIVPEKNTGQFIGQVYGVKPGDHLDFQTISVDVVPAYNVNKAYHPKDRQYVGYILTVDDTRLYHAGDTDVIPEMSNIRADVAFLPVGGTYTMNAQEAAEAAEIIHPKLAIPIHWGSVAGYRTDAERFSRLSHVRSMVLEQESE
ncbi:MBL fold metallo-hydrolase [bacterium]|nr:MBL fold metallo-hydrolase [bacterium]